MFTKKKEEPKPEKMLDISKIDPELQKALIKASGDSDTDSQDPTKFTLLENLHNKATAEFYTEYGKTEQVEQMNRLIMWIRLFPLVFGNSDNVRLYQNIAMEHCFDHMKNMASHKRKRESALVYAVKQDTGLIQTDRQVKTFLGRHG